VRETWRSDRRRQSWSQPHAAPCAVEGPGFGGRSVEVTRTGVARYPLLCGAGAAIVTGGTSAYAGEMFRGECEELTPDSMKVSGSLNGRGGSLNCLRDAPVAVAPARGRAVVLTTHPISAASHGIDRSPGPTDLFDSTTARLRAHEGGTWMSAPTSDFRVTVARWDRASMPDCPATFTAGSSRRVPSVGSMAPHRT
jgi:hypothetical protein